MSAQPNPVVAAEHKKKNLRAPSDYGIASAEEEQLALLHSQKLMLKETLDKIGSEPPIQEICEREGGMHVAACQFSLHLNVVIVVLVYTRIVPC